jgi:hypothetical protein
MGKFRRAPIIAAAALAVLHLITGASGAGAQVRNLDKPGAFAIEGGVSLRNRAAIEQQTKAGWRPVFEEFYLTEDCAAAARLPACVTLKPGETLRPVRWTGFTCQGQCSRSCKKNIYRPPGTFRLTLTTCDGAQLSGAPFHMGAGGKQ